MSEFATRLALMLGEQSEVPETALQVDGYRWEQGIGEWIAATPAVLGRSSPADDVATPRTPSLPVLPVVMNEKTAYSSAYTPIDLSSDVLHRPPTPIPDIVPPSPGSLSTDNENATPAVSRVYQDNLNRPSGCLEALDSSHFVAQCVSLRNTGRASATRTTQTRLRTSSTSTSMTQGKKRHYWHAVSYTHLTLPTKRIV